MNKKIIFLIGILFIIPFINAALECPVGWICGWQGTSVEIGGGLVCLNDIGPWKDLEGGFEYPTEAIGDNPVFTCVDPSGGAGCCKSGSTCKEPFSGEVILPLPDNPGSLGSCQADLKDFCFQFDDEDECNSANFEIAKDTMDPTKIDEYPDGYCGKKLDFRLVGTETCWDDISCMCFWDTDSNSCDVIDEILQDCTNGTTSVDYGPCQWDATLLDNCDVDGYIYMKDWQLISGDVADCGSKPDTQILCTDITKLGFFNWINTIAVIVILIIIYYFFISKKKK